MLKTAFKSAALAVLRMKKHPLLEAYEKMLEAGTKPNLARLTLARRIAAAALAIWKNKEDCTRCVSPVLPPPAAMPHGVSHADAKERPSQIGFDRPWHRTTPLALLPPLARSAHSRTLEWPEGRHDR
jgi:hypothetical protein